MTKGRIIILIQNCLIYWQMLIRYLNNKQTSHTKNGYEFFVITTKCRFSDFDRCVMYRKSHFSIHEIDIMFKKNEDKKLNTFQI
jgi:hypothetical protein